MTTEVKITKRHVNKIFGWCLKTYGKSKYNRTFPTIHFKKPDHTNEDCSGVYDEFEHTIFINKEQHDTLDDLVNTIIHEYTHYKQNMKHYQILALYLDNDKHPMEIEAEQVAERDMKKCLKEVFNIDTLEEV
jgi:hypothetical protein